MNERQMTDLQRHRTYKALLQRPTFDSEDDARENMRAKDGEFRRFLIRGKLGTYRVCYAYVSHPRDGEPVWAYNEEFIFSCAEIYAVKNRLALDIGLKLVEEME